MLITVIRPVKIGGYSTLTLRHTVLGQWTVCHAAEDGKTIGSREKPCYLLSKFSPLSPDLVTGLKLMAQGTHPR